MSVSWFGSIHFGDRLRKTAFEQMKAYQDIKKDNRREAAIRRDRRFRQGRTLLDRGGCMAKPRLQNLLKDVPI
jgi:hypothetical protein